MPTNNEYFKNLMTSITSSEAIAGGTTLQQLRDLIVKERFNILKKKLGYRMRDLIGKMFGVKPQPTDSVIPIATHVMTMDKVDVLNTADDQGDIVTRFRKVDFGGNKIQFTSPWFGIVFVTGSVTPIDIAVTRGLNPQYDNNFVKDAYGYYRPEAQGMAYKNLKLQHIDATSGMESNIGSASIYDELRAYYSVGKGHYSRPTGWEKEISTLNNWTSISVQSLNYFDSTVFDPMFVEEQHIKFKLQFGGTINRPIKNILA